MSNDILTQGEVEHLLNTMSADGLPEASGPANGAVEPAAGPRPQGREQVAPYDFKRPERVGKEQMRALQTLHEGFGRNFAAGLSAMLRSMVEVKLTSVDQLTYSEFVFSLENPTCFNLLKADAAGREPDPRHQPVDPLPDHRPALGRRPRRWRSWPGVR